MKIEIIRKDQFKTSRWSGGTTTQLLIYPESAQYQERNFLWRLSSARVEDEESVFTSLPGFARILMVIDGELRIEHEGKHSAYLKPLEQDAFMGDWNTRSFGIVTDFNLMMTKECSGRVDAISIKKEETAEVPMYALKEEYTQVSNIFYAASGDFVLKIDKTKCTISILEGDLVSITHSSSEIVTEITLGNAIGKEGNIIRTLIYY
jgi:uncharacterized protein